MNGVVTYTEQSTGVAAIDRAAKGNTAHVLSEEPPDRGTGPFAWSFICVTWLIHMCATTHSHVCHDSFICVTWLIHMFYMTQSLVWLDPLYVTWLIHMCDMTHSYVWHDSFICVTWLIHMCDMTQSLVWLDPLYVTWLVCMWNDRAILGDTACFTCVFWRDWIICVTWPFIRDNTRAFVKWLSSQGNTAHILWGGYD